MEKTGGIIMGRYIDCGEDTVFKYAPDQPSNLNLIHEYLGLGTLKHYTDEESYGNGCDMLYLSKGDITIVESIP